MSQHKAEKEKSFLRLVVDTDFFWYSFQSWSICYTSMQKVTVGVITDWQAEEEILKDVVGDLNELIGTKHNCSAEDTGKRSQ